MFAFDNVRDLGVKQLDAISSTATTAAKGFQAIAAETLDYSTKAWECNRAFGEKALKAKNPSDLIELHTSFAKETLDELTSRVSKLNKLYFDMGKENFERWTEGLSKTK